MKKEMVIVWIGLIILTIVSAIVSISSLKYAVEIILALAAVKFIGVSFYFMDIKVANVFWKSSILLFLSILIIFISFIIKS